MTAPAESPARISTDPSIEAFLCELRELRRLSPHTVEAYRRDLTQLRLVTGDDWAVLHPADLRAALARLHAAGAAPSSLARALSAWRTFFTWLGQRGTLQINPAAGLRPPRRAQRLPKALAPDQAVQYAAHSPADTDVARRDKAIVELLYSSGLRLAELVRLDWRYFAAEPRLAASTSWLDLPGRQVTVLGKGGRTRTVPVGRAAADALQEWLQHRASVPRADARALFISARGTRIAPRSVQQRLAQLARALHLGVHVHPHVLRHSMASHVLQSSGDLRAVQELLGHASISSTQIYTRLDWQHLARVYDAAHPRARRKA